MIFDLAELPNRRSYCYPNESSWANRTLINCAFIFCTINVLFAFAVWWPRSHSAGINSRFRLPCKFIYKLFKLHNVSAHQLPIYNQSQQVSITGWTALVRTYLRSKLTLSKILKSLTQHFGRLLLNCCFFEASCRSISWGIQEALVLLGCKVLAFCKPLLGTTILTDFPGFPIKNFVLLLKTFRVLYVVDPRVNLYFLKFLLALM